MRHVLLLWLPLVVCACVAPPDITVSGPDGQKRISIQCRDVQNCLIRAGRYCPDGYDDSNEGRRPHELLIRCKTPTSATSLGDWKD